MTYKFRFGKYLYIIILIQLALLLLNVYGLGTRKESTNGDRTDNRMYFAIAAMPNTTYSRIFNRTLSNLTQNLIPKTKINFALDTLPIELPKNGKFSALFLKELCSKLEKKNVLAIFVIGDSQAAFTIKLAATHIGIPLLWAKGQSGISPGFRSLVS
ncbi:hypothetical protein WA026_014195 [Henosepilachna vigintioctopunctata]|uniref:Receptor ligand binding region domain-containing protein n=1 Tax=Henosepilachna vigintioctopunctata TaxID=420089 RepID=A0AAW1TUG3_9CUCU